MLVPTTRMLSLVGYLLWLGWYSGSFYITAAWDPSTPPTLFSPAYNARDWASLLGKRADIQDGPQLEGKWSPDLGDLAQFYTRIGDTMPPGNNTLPCPILSSGIILFFGAPKVGFGSPRLGCLCLYKQPSVLPFDECQPLPPKTFTTPSQKKEEEARTRFLADGAWEQMTGRRQVRQLPLKGKFGFSCSSQSFSSWEN